jgi:hypothetical protein
MIQLNHGRCKECGERVEGMDHECPPLTMTAGSLLIVEMVVMLRRLMTRGHAADEEHREACDHCSGLYAEARHLISRYEAGER